jgi:hypothetical protein
MTNSTELSWSRKRVRVRVRDDFTMTNSTELSRSRKRVGKVVEV